MLEKIIRFKERQNSKLVLIKPLFETDTKSKRIRLTIINSAIAFMIFIWAVIQRIF